MMLENNRKYDRKRKGINKYTGCVFETIQQKRQLVFEGHLLLPFSCVDVNARYKQGNNIYVVVFYLA